MESVDDSKIVKNYVPTLLHQACVRIALSLYEEFSLPALFLAFRKVQEGDAFKRNYTFEGARRAQEKLLLMPKILRNEVIEAVHSMLCLAEKWRGKPNFVKYLFCYRCDGTFDGIKSAKQMARNTCIGAIKRFYVASYYCLEESVEALWTQLEACGKTEKLLRASYCMVKFWVGRMQRKSRVPWRQDIQDYFKDPQNEYGDARFSTFFPSLKREERHRFLDFIQHADNDDYLLCLYAMTKEEEHEMLTKNPLKLLCVYMEWPFQNLFREASEKMWKYLDEETFRQFLSLPFSRFRYLETIAGKDSEFYELYEDFWNRSPFSWRENLKKNHQALSEKVNSFLNVSQERRRKRENILMGKPISSNSN